HRRAKPGSSLGRGATFGTVGHAADPLGHGPRAAPPGNLGHARAGRLGRGRGALHRRWLVRRLHRFLRRRRRGDGAGRPARGRHRQGQGSAGVTAGRKHAARSGTATERLQRLLALVPYVVSREVVGLAETAGDFGVTESELVDDLNMLWCVELRSPDPYCPIDLSYEGGEIMVSQAESMDRPLRLGTDEASALLIGLRTLAELPGPQDG